MKKYFINSLLVIITGFSLQSCVSTKGVTTEIRTLDTLEITPQEPSVYQASATRKHDLIHTELYVNFDWQKQYMNGKATLTVRPYFHATSLLELDAKGMDIHKVALKEGDVLSNLTYDYDSLLLSIHLNKIYTRTDTFAVYIEYTAKPNEIKAQGSAAISDAKGLYFINPLGEEENKPQQIWTQGETEASSCWFPTIDRPNEKMTQEIYITVNEKYKTLSNGELVYQTENGDGTRTDYWKQHKPHTPYLAMMAIGDFAVVEDSWRDSVDVNYYVEHEYAQYAKDIFGHTPEMMEFFSMKMGVDYPWYKYHQAVVRDYVSGAMENTSAVIHGSFLHQTKREMIDGDNQDIIAHELFHHWFGDLVTCESWSNLPLNESFATYGEYLWREYKHGRAAADEHLDGDLRSYLNEAKYKQENMIRFNYVDKEDMFDSHSYAKGGRILHMLRYYVGDDAFFESLRVYLTDNAYQTVEIHDLRKAFEKVTGEDLNWFFNQWFLSSGHPKLEINTSYNDSLKEATVMIKQLQNLKETPLYYLPINVDFYLPNEIKREQIILKQQEQSFTFYFDTKPKLINVDADKMLLCEKIEDKSIEEWIYQYNSAPLLIDRKEALDGLKPHLKTNELAYETILSSLNDENEIIRKKTINTLEIIAEDKKDEIAGLLVQVAESDKSSKVRASAIKALGDFYEDSTHTEVFIKALNDSSYKVIEEALMSLSLINGEKAMSLAENLEKDSNKKIQNAVAEVYAQHGDSTVHNYFIERSKSISGYAKYSFAPTYVDYLSKHSNCSPEILSKAIPILTSFEGGDYFKQFYAYLLTNLSNAIQAEQNSIDEQIKEEKDPLTLENMQKKKSAYNMPKEELNEYINKLKKE